MTTTASNLRAGDHILLAQNDGTHASYRVETIRSAGWDRFAVLIRERDGVVARCDFRADTPITHV